MVFQNPGADPHLSVFDNLAFGLSGRGMSRRQARLRVNSLAGILGLDRVLARDPRAPFPVGKDNAWRSACALAR